MYVSIDLQNLRVHHVHSDQDVVWELVYLECGALRHVRVDNTSSDQFLNTLGIFQLRKLYENLTGFTVDALDDLSIRSALSVVIAKIPQTKVNRDTLLAQCEFAAAKGVESKQMAFSYLPGVREPSTVPAVPLKGVPLLGDALAQAPQLAPQRPFTPAAATPLASTETRPTGPRFAARAPAGSTRPKIWSVADEMWAAAGKPTDKNTVLALRKEMMNRLEEEGVKRTSSSNELGNWMKDRIP